MVGRLRGAQWLMLILAVVAAHQDMTTLEVRPLEEFDDTAASLLQLTAFANPAKDGLKEVSDKSKAANAAFNAAAAKLKAVLPSTPAVKTAPAPEGQALTVQEAAEAAKHEAKSRSEATDAAKRQAQDALDDWKKAALHEKTSATNAIAKAQLAAADINAKAAMTIAQAAAQAKMMRAEAVRATESADHLQSKATGDSHRIDTIQQQLSIPASEISGRNSTGLVQEKAKKAAKAVAAAKAAEQHLKLLQTHAAAAQNDATQAMQEAAKNKADMIKRKMQTTREKMRQAQKELDEATKSQAGTSATAKKEEALTQDAGSKGSLDTAKQASAEASKAIKDLQAATKAAKQDQAKAATDSKVAQEAQAKATKDTKAAQEAQTKTATDMDTAKKNIDKAAKKAQDDTAKAVTKTKKAQDDNVQDACKCSGHKNKDGKGGKCAKWGWKEAWCYVSKACKYEGVQTAKENGHKWVAGCSEQ